ncbi:MAG: beta-Ala-His dipeptidase [Lachnospiraceae bacterium]|nr:beta-Ala-His dipeptidase [Lachnospiraceae bacterium]
MKDKVIDFFKDLCAIPHGSGNCCGVGDYLVRFAQDRGLEYVRDKKGNVLIRRSAVGSENSSERTVILQGHQDMVCVKTDDCPLDMSRDPLDVRTENGYIYAKGTSLGADDGIGVAMVLAVLDDGINPHPPIEALFTVDEETGMSGAAAFDTTLLVGKKFINLDSEEEGVVTTACAGGERLDVRIPLSLNVFGKNGQALTEMSFVKIQVSGLAGGHSGCDIHKGRLSALRVITDLLGKISDFDICLAEYGGGRFDNVICSDAYAVILVDPSKKNALLSHLYEIKDKAFLGYVKIEKGISVDISTSDGSYRGKGFALGIKETREFIEAMKNIPQGVTLMMQERPDCVDTSMNLGTAVMTCNELKLTFSLRSNCDERRKELEKRVTDAVSDITGASWNVRDPYPAWQYAVSSPLRDTLCASYKELFGSDMETAVTHGGLECGYFASRIKGCELVSIGPQIDDIHSVKEKIAIDSVDRCIKLLIKTLENL